MEERPPDRHGMAQRSVALLLSKDDYIWSVKLKKYNYLYKTNKKEMASANPGLYMNRAYGNITDRTNRVMVISTVLVAALSFASMVTAAYTADHIQKSSCWKDGADESLKHAYKWSCVTAVIGGVTTAGMVAILVKTALSKSKSA